MLYSQDIGSEPLEQAEEIEEEKPRMNLKERLFFGGNLGAQFGSYTYINVAPLGGLKISDKWSIGTQITYSYVNINYSNYRYQDHIYGASLFSRYFIFKNIFAHVETEALNGDWKANGERFNVNSLFLGGGYVYRISDKAGVGITAMFNVLQNQYSPYRNPIINAGFTYGL
ncbi:hypothetical protein N8911_01030 [bacterium]|jgi:hypothetical protein|nr:hypothetical protein [bacterium]